VAWRIRGVAYVCGCRRRIRLLGVSVDWRRSVIRWRRLAQRGGVLSALILAYLGRGCNQCWPCLAMLIGVAGGGYSVG